MAMTLSNDWIDSPEADRIRERDSVKLRAIDLVGRTPSAEKHSSGLPVSETFTFAMSTGGLRPATSTVTFTVTADLAFALLEEGDPGDLEATAWSELATLGSSISVTAEAGAVDAVRRERERG